MFRSLILIIAIGLAVTQFSEAQDKLVASYPAAGGTQGPLWAAKDLGIFDKYGLNVDVILVPGSARGIQALLANSVQVVQTDPSATVIAAARGAELAIIAQPLNKFPFTFLAQKDIRKPSDLIGKKIGILNFGGATEVAVTAALKEWNVPLQAVTLLPVGGAGTRFTALLNGSIDATVLVPPESFVAAQKGMTVLAQLSDLKMTFPYTVITVGRAFLKNNPNVMKRYIQAYSEAIFQFKTDSNKAKAVYAKRLGQQNPMAIQETYDYYAPSFSFPPKPDANALRGVLDLERQRLPENNKQIDVEQFLDESLVGVLEKEGFFKKLTDGRVNK
jgi:NitT/TauT family transport system substrate-binding protein